LAYTYEDEVSDFLFTVFENEKVKHRITKDFSEFIEALVKNKPRLAAVVVHTKSPTKVLEVATMVEGSEIPLFVYVPEGMLGRVVDEVSKMEEKEIIVMREDRIIKLKEALSKIRVLNFGA